ncbi:hypothetical protein FWP33_07675 [Vibrio parahaemolyticus]|uniref:Uncharacterized protein n=1 Tax=Vibrio parahaemolyticus TaxID=670 RepID=A0A9Q3UA96_VIBPH|nr:hypothetical protein [Vibrio parahaemolyticus]EGQ9742399.1 hypothetical protein [Vibrio parahaemolyticus]MCC3804050.1 hypothetical protein [Vibrio parahaemolyticus]
MFKESEISSIIKHTIVTSNNKHPQFLSHDMDLTIISSVGGEIKLPAMVSSHDLEKLTTSKR